MYRMVGDLSHSGEEPAAKLPQNTSQADVLDLRQLNQAEREALHLLAEGHTAKSIASLTGRSVAAINERLREARRKTGASSSRELARLLRAQKSWDEEMGMASPAAAGASTHLGALPSRAGSAGTKGTIVMGTFVIAGIAAAAFWLQETPQTSSEPVRGAASMERQGAPSARKDSLLGEMFSSQEQEPRQLFERVRTETRDATWAARAEAAIKARYAHLSSAGQVEKLRIICGATVCEMAGLIVGKGENDVDVTMQDIQDHRLEISLAEIGLKRHAASFRSRPNSGETAFATYWLRSTR